MLDDDGDDQTVNTVLIDSLVRFGYPRSVLNYGACQGVSVMAIQAALSGKDKAGRMEIDNFLKRIELIAGYDFPDELFEVVERLKTRVASGEAAIECLSPDERLLLEVPNFLAGIYRHQNDEYQVVSSEQHDESLDATSSQRLKDLGGISKRGTFTGLYTRPELSQYLLELQKILDGLDIPVALMLSNFEHAAVLMYDSECKGFRFFDPEYLVDTFIALSSVDAADGIAETIKLLFDEENSLDCGVALRTEIYGLKRDQIEIKTRIIDPWRAGQVMKSMHQVSPEKAEWIKRDNSWLLVVSSAGDEEGLTSLLDAEIDLNVAGVNGLTALQTAAMRGQPNIVKILLDHGALLGVVGRDGDNELHMATQGNQLEVVGILLACGARVDSIDPGGCTALYVASHEGYAEVAQALIDAGANVNLPDEFGNTALHVAAQNGHTHVVQVLLKAEADVDLPNKAGFTALQLAARNDRSAIAKMLSDSAATDVSLFNRDRDRASSPAYFDHLARSSLLEKVGSSAKRKAAIMPSEESKEFVPPKMKR